MASESLVRQLFLPYCLKLQPDGSYVFLNRNYVPLGVTDRAFVDYATHPGRVRFARALSARQVSFLSYNGDSDPGTIYLYNDGCVPSDSDEHWKAYSAKLQRLASYKVKH